MARRGFLAGGGALLLAGFEGGGVSATAQGTGLTLFLCGDVMTGRGL